MNITCPECSSKFDVSTFEPGSTFPCANCRHTLTVPGGGEAEAEVAGTAKPKRKRPEGWGKVQHTGPVSVPGGKPVIGKKKEPPTRAAPTPGAGRAADPRAAAAPKTRAEPEPRRRRTGEPGEKSSSATPLLLGLGGLAVVAVIVAVVVLGGGGEKKDDPKGAGGSGQAARAGGQDRQESTPTDPKDMTYPQRRDVHRKLALKALVPNKSAAIDAWRDAYAFAEQWKMAREKREDLEEILKLDSQDAWANEKRGHKLFTYEHMPKAEPGVFPWERKGEILAVVEQGRNGKVWVTARQHAELTELQKQESEHLRRLETDPQYRRTGKIIADLQDHPIYKEWAVEVSGDHPPYLVFVQDTGEGIDPENLDGVVARNGRILGNLHRSWKELLEPEIRKLSGQGGFELPPLGVGEGDDPSILKVYVFASEEDWEEFGASLSTTLPEGAGAHYDRSRQWLSLDGGGDDGTEWWGRQSRRSGWSFRAGARQLLHHWTVLVTNRANARSGDPAISYNEVSWRSHWFTEGLAEMFGGADETEQNAKWECFRVNHSRAKEYRDALAQTLPMTDVPVCWTLEQVVRMDGESGLSQAALRRTFVDENQKLLTSLFGAQAWAFCHFLWNAESGKYRPYFVSYALSELESKSGYAYFERIFKPVLDAEGGWAGVEKKVIAYLRSLPDVSPSNRGPFGR